MRLGWEIEFAGNTHDTGAVFIDSGAVIAGHAYTLTLYGPASAVRTLIDITDYVTGSDNVGDTLAVAPDGTCGPEDDATPPRQHAAKPAAAQNPTAATPPNNPGKQTHPRTTRSRLRAIRHLR